MAGMKAKDTEEEEETES
jgi:hypothetical protein